MKVKSTVTIYRQRLRELTRASAVSLTQTAEALKTEVQQAQVVPRDTGNLQNESFFVDDKDARSGTVRLVHQTPYARRVYFNPDGVRFHRQPWESVEIVTGTNGTYRKRVRHDGNPHAKDHWFEDWLPGGTKQDFCANTFKRLYHRNGGLS